MPLCLVVQSGRGASSALFRCVSKSKNDIVFILYSLRGDFCIAITRMTGI